MKAFTLIEAMLAQLLSIMLFVLVLLFLHYFWGNYHQQQQVGRFSREALVFDSWVRGQIQRARDWSQSKHQLTFHTTNPATLEFQPEPQVSGQPFFTDPVEVVWEIQSRDQLSLLAIQIIRNQTTLELKFQLPSSAAMGARTWYESD